MDFLVELLVQFFVQVVLELFAEFLFETALHGLANLLVTRVGRVVTGALVGFGFGFAWGHHLSGGAHWPKLLWVSLGLAAAAAVTAVGRAGAAPAQVSGSRRWRDRWREVATPPWEWDAARLAGFAVLNAAIATGIGLSFRAGSG